MQQIKNRLEKLFTAQILLEAKLYQHFVLLQEHMLTIKLYRVLVSFA